VLRDASGRTVAEATGPAGVLTVDNVHRWAPGDGYLYDLEVQLVDEEGAVVDEYHQSVGVRTVKVSGNRFLINGEPFYFTGFGKHEDIAVIGKGHNDAFMVHDFELLKVDRRQLVPHIALPVLGGRAGLRRPQRHRAH
jgi:beta-glucuronidase